jgi:Fe-S cluster biogenesis protein NfuA
MPPIAITAEPADNHRCKFTVSVPIMPGGARRFESSEDAAGSPLAEALFRIPEVTEVLVSGSAVTITKRDTAPWQVAGKAVGTAIRSALESGAPAVVARPVAGNPADDDALFAKIATIFDTRINPMVAGHGGRVDLIDVQDSVVMLRLMGGCQGCGMADVTLRQGIEATLKQIAPEVRGVVDVTDHSTGANPYFASAKK